MRNLMELCQHDYSEYDCADVDEHGLFGYKYLDHYWMEAGRHAFLVRVAGKLAGFVLVRRVDSGDKPAIHTIAELFVMRKYRRQGIGRQVAWQMLDLFPGQWSIAQEEGNRPAQSFWRRVIDGSRKGRIRTKNCRQKNGMGHGRDFKVGRTTRRHLESHFHKWIGTERSVLQGSGQAYLGEALP